MNSIVIELQSEALDQRTHAVDLLRKALVIARKLKIKDFEEWVNRELNGYYRPADVPRYRVLRGEVKAMNPYHGWIPVFFPAEIAELVTTHHVAEPLSAIENASRHKGVLAVAFPPKIEERLVSSMDVPMRPVLHLQPSQMLGVVNAVRNIVLDWTLQLEEQHILGEGMTFSPQEKAAATSSTVVNNFLGPVGHSNVMSSSPGAAQTLSINNLQLDKIAALAEEIATKVEEMGLSVEDANELRAEASTIKTQAASPRPKEVIIKEALSSVRRLLESAGGNLAARYISKLIGLTP